MKRLSEFIWIFLLAMWPTPLSPQEKNRATYGSLWKSISAPIEGEDRSAISFQLPAPITYTGVHPSLSNLSIRRYETEIFEQQKAQFHLISTRFHAIIKQKLLWRNLVWYPLDSTPHPIG